MITAVHHNWFFFLTQVEDKDVELRELKSALANLKDHHDQAQSKV